MHQPNAATHSASAIRVAMVVSRYHDEVTSALEDGALSAFLEAGGERSRVKVIRAPGAFEIPFLAARAARSGAFDAIVALGCVISGETTHDRYICDSVAHALQQIATETAIAIGFGILTCQTVEQARARAGGDKGNKGADAMIAAIDAAGEAARLKNTIPSAGIEDALQ